MRASNLPSYKIEVSPTRAPEELVNLVSPLGGIVSWDEGKKTATVSPEDKHDVDAVEGCLMRERNLTREGGNGMITLLKKLEL